MERSASHRSADELLSGTPCRQNRNERGRLRADGERGGGTAGTAETRACDSSHSRRADGAFVRTWTVRTDGVVGRRPHENPVRDRKKCVECVNLSAVAKWQRKFAACFRVYQRPFKHHGLQRLSPDGSQPANL